MRQIGCGCERQHLLMTHARLFSDRDTRVRTNRLFFGTRGVSHSTIPILWASIGAMPRQGRGLFSDLPTERDNNSSISYNQKQ